MVALQAYCVSQLAQRRLIVIITIGIPGTLAAIHITLVTHLRVLVALAATTSPAGTFIS